MQEENNHISFTVADIRKYHEGKLTPGQMHELEKAALEDPFLADALEGYLPENGSLPADTAELNQRLAARIEEHNNKKVIPLAAPKSFNWLRAAAMVIAVAGAGLLVYKSGFVNTSKDIAQVTSKEAAKETIEQDSAPASVTPAREDTSAAGANGLVAIPEKANTARMAKQAKPAAPPLPEPLKTIKEEQASQAAPPAALERNAPGAAPVTDHTFKSPALDSVKPALVNKNAAMYEYKAKADAESAMKKENAMTSLGKARRSQGFIQGNIFRGKVTDLQNNPLPFANITNSRDNVGTYSDAQGNFVLTSPDSVMDVQVRSLGFENNNAILQNGVTSNKVVLKDDRSLTEVVISNKKINSRMREGNMVLEEPEPADGWSNYDTYLANNLNVPDTYKSRQSGGGEVELSFEVNQLGEPVNIKVIRSLCEVCDKEAIRLLKEGPKWKRKAKKGQRTTVTIPF